MLEGFAASKAFLKMQGHGKAPEERHVTGPIFFENHPIPGITIAPAKENSSRA
jgi:hypothetical protein